MTDIIGYTLIIIGILFNICGCIGLARFPRTHVKLSGFYALSQPGYAYPHRAAWPYVQVLADAFSTKRLLWGSDFTPSLGLLSFPQTVGLFAEMPFLSGDDRQRIEGANLARLLGQVRTDGIGED